MPRELVGDAYVRIFADTKYMAKAIRDDLRKAGKNSADSFLTDFDKTLRESADARLKRSQTALADAITGGNFDAMLKQSGKSVDEFVTDVEADLRRLDSRKSVRFEGLQDALDSLSEWKGTAKIREDAERLAATLDDDWVAASRLNKEFERQQKVGAELAKTYDSFETASMRGSIRDLTRDLDTSNRAFDDLHASALRVNADFDKNARAARDSGESVHRTRRAIHDLNDDLDRFSVAGGIGRIFGKGSRNDFLNVLGGAIGGMVGLGEAVVKLPFRAVQLLSDGFEDLTGHFKELRAAGVGVRGILTEGITAGLKGAIPAVIGLVVAAGALSTILPLAVTAVSTALAGLTAIIGAISVAITGALLPLVPIAVALAAAIAPVVIGFLALKKAADSNVNTFAGLKRGYADLVKDLGPFIRGLREEFNGFGKVIGDLGPFLSDMGGQVLDVIGNFRELFSLPEMKTFTKQWADVLPRVFGNVGNGIVNLTGALTAFFTPILPYAERISDAFLKMTEDFLGWTTSAEGQNSIADFMGRAYEAAKSLGTILVNVGVAIAKTFDIGTQEGGQSFLDYLVDLTTRWREWVDSPEGKETLKEWFNNARTAGEKLFGIIGDIFEFFGTLDTEEARGQLNDLLTSLQSASDSLGTIAGAINTIDTAFDDFGSAIGGFLDANGDDLTLIIGYMNDFGSAINDGLAPAVNQIVPIFQQIGADLATSTEDIQTTLTSFYTWLVTPPDFSSITGYLTAPFALAALDIGAHLLYFQQQVFTFLAALPAQILGWLAGVPAAMVFPIQTGIALAVAEVATLPGRAQAFLLTVPGVVTAALTGLLTALPQPFRDGISNVLGALDRGIGDITGRIGGWASAVGGVVTGVIGALTAPFEEALRQINGILSQIGSAAGRIPGVSQLGDLFHRNAAGGILYRATVIAPGQIAGEDGREAIVPLDRPLSMIDPSVRALAAYAQGKSFSSGDNGRHLTVMPGAIAVTVPNADPVAAAEAMLDRLIPQIR